MNDFPRFHMHSGAWCKIHVCSVLACGKSVEGSKDFELDPLQLVLVILIKLNFLTFIKYAVKCYLGLDYRVLLY